MQLKNTLLCLSFASVTLCLAQPGTQAPGKPFQVVVTPHKTTMLADGKDTVLLYISVVDKNGLELAGANNLIRFSLTGDGKIISIRSEDPGTQQKKVYDTSGEQHLYKGRCLVVIQSSQKQSTIHFEARADSLYSGNTDIEAVQPGTPHPVTTGGHPFPISNSITRPVDKMLGADISFLPELEERGMKFYDKGVEKDAIKMLADHRFNYVRLRIFVNPENDSGYSPKKGFCDLVHTKEMAKRVKAAGMKLLLDFHYSDYWADPGKQYKPVAWRNQDFTGLQRSVYDHTKMVMQELKDQGTEPDMVQVGNEINHGMIWPDGSINNLDSLARLIYAGINGVKAVSPSTTIMVHIALGGQNEEAHFFLDNMIKREVPFDVIGLSYYPRWHGTLDDLKYNINELSTYYKKDLIIVEYSQYKQEVNDIGFNVAGGRGKGTCIWEPLNTWESLFDKDGNANDFLYLYDNLNKKYISNN